MPADNATYAADAAFGAGGQIGSTGWFCVYDGTGSSVTVTSLSGGTSYRVMVCEYNGSADIIFYNIDAAPGNPATVTTSRQPILAWNTFLGGEWLQSGLSVAVDSSGNAYIAGSSYADWGSPVVGYTDAGDGFVAKVSTSGSLVWHTFLGGPDNVDRITGISCSPDGYIYAAGYSQASWGSPLNPYTVAGGGDALVAKLNSSTGELVWHTFLGGSGYDSASSIDIDSEGNIYVAGESFQTWGSPKRAYTAGKDGFIAKLNTSGAVFWNTFIGGGGNDELNSIAVNAAGGVFVTGISNAAWGSPERGYTTGTDGTAAKILDNGTLAWHTFLGGAGSDYMKDVASSTGEIFIAGYSTASWGAPLNAFTPGLENELVTKLLDNGTLVWNTFFGGSDDDYLETAAVGANGNVYVGGWSLSSWGSPLWPYTGNYDATVAQLDPDGTLVWRAFLGGGDYDDICGMAMSANGNLYVTGESDAAWGSPVRAYTASSDCLVAKILLPPVQASTIVAANTAATQTGISWTRGSGEQCAVFMKLGDSDTAAPVNNATYTASTAFGSGGQIGSTGWFCVYNGTGSSVTVTGLSANTSYRVMVCEYNGAGEKIYYADAAAEGNPATVTTNNQLPTTTTTAASSTTTTASITTTTTQPGSTTTTTVNTKKCPAKTVLNTSSGGILTIFYKFRDTRLARTTAGREMIAMYYKHGSEVSRMFEDRAELKAAARRLVFKLSPDMFLGLYRHNKVKITQAENSSIIDLFNKVKETASPGLHADIDGLLEKIADESLQRDLGYEVK